MTWLLLVLVLALPLVIGLVFYSNDDHFDGK
jgi:hypothetical protein